MPRLALTGCGGHPAYWLEGPSGQCGAHGMAVLFRISLALTLLLSVLASAQAAPRVYLWAWERPEDLSFVDTARVGVAYLAGTLCPGADGSEFRPRLQRLSVPGTTSLIAVVRVDPAAGARLTASPKSIGDAATKVLRAFDPKRVLALQVDCDARRSERAWYAALLRELRKRLSSTVRLSITALASWCWNDPWLASLPVDEAVPMLFSMGPESLAFRRRVSSNRSFGSAQCRGALGISTDEPFPRLPKVSRLYVFHPRPWTAAVVERLLREVGE